eukprot:jgi/Psemu1/212385/e_gw1.599.41.1
MPCGCLCKTSSHLQQACTISQPFNSSILLVSYVEPCEQLTPVRTDVVTRFIRISVQTLFPYTGIAPSNISARGSLRAGGQQPCCRKNVTPMSSNSRWHSDTMMRYLHQQPVPIFKNLASLLFKSETYYFLPDEWVPVADTTHPDSSL